MELQEGRKIALDLPITSFKTPDEVIEKANDCVYGLTSSIYTQDFDTVIRAMNEIHFGETYVNREHFDTYVDDALKTKYLSSFNGGT